MYTYFIQSFKILATFCSWAGWFESNLVENPQRHIFAWYGSSYSHSSIRWRNRIWFNQSSNGLIEREAMKSDLNIWGISFDFFFKKYRVSINYFKIRTAWEATVEVVFSEETKIQARFNQIQLQENVHVQGKFLLNHFQWVEWSVYCSTNHIILPSIYISLVTRKPVFGISDQARLKPASSTSETS